MQLLRRLSFTMLLMSMMTLVACGDGDGDLTGGDDGGGGTPEESIVITLTKSDGELSADNDITVSATVTNDGSAVANKTVTYTLAVEGSATLDPLSGTATTDSNGVATIVVKVTDMKGSVNVIATYENTSENISFDSAGDGEGSLSGGAKISIDKSEGDLSAENDVIISASIISNDNGEGVVGKLVTFTLNDPAMATFDPVIGTAVTDDSGLATIIVKVTDVAGGVEVTASVSDGTDTAFTRIGFTSVGDGVKVVEGEPIPDNITLIASSLQLASSGAQGIELIAIAKDASNHLLSGVTINFEVDSGTIGGIENADGEVTNVTDIHGQVKKGLITFANPENRTITVNVSNGEVSDSLQIEVVGTTVTLAGTSSLAINDEASYIVNVLDSDGNGIANSVVAVSLSGLSTETPAGSVASVTIPSTVTTDNEGQAIIKATGTSGGTNTIIVNALGASTSQDISVQADSFLFTSFSNGVDTVNPSSSPDVPDVSLAQTASVTLTWLRDGVNVSDGTPVKITTTRGVLSSSEENTVGGKITVTLTSDNAGKALVTLVGTDTDNGKDIELSNQLEFEFFADTAATIKAQASPNSIGPNEQKSTISVVVKDANGNRVKNKKVKFILTDISGGSIFPATAVTDSSGSASTIYTSNSTSAKDAISIEAIVEDTPAITDSVTLTVSERELFITLGTGNEIEELGTTDYVKEYSVFVTDADSNAVANVDLTISAVPHKYYKGYWYPVYDGDDFVSWVTMGADKLESLMLTTMPPKSCDNEDLNFDGVLDVGEDSNGDNFLTPGNVVAAQSSLTTDSDGRAVIRIIYSQSYGSWIDVKLIASARVTGTESSTQTIFKLPTLASDVNQEKLTPPTRGVGLRGPFGLLNDCSLNISQDPNLDGT